MHGASGKVHGGTYMSYSLIRKRATGYEGPDNPIKGFLEVPKRPRHGNVGAVYMRIGTTSPSAQEL